VSTQPTKAELEAWVAAMLSPDGQLESSAFWLKKTNNPTYAWRAIAICTTYKKEFPEWVVAYLAECAERMDSQRAKKSNDLRKNLPWILAFPKKHGPGNLLNPEHGHDPLFVLKFVARVLQGEPPIDAMRDACNDVFDEQTAAVDDKTLRRWLLKMFDLKEPGPANPAEWKRIARRYLAAVIKSWRNYQRTKSRGTLG